MRFIFDGILNLRSGVHKSNGCLVVFFAAVLWNVTQRTPMTSQRKTSKKTWCQNARGKGRFRFLPFSACHAGYTQVVTSREYPYFVKHFGLFNQWLCFQVFFLVDYVKLRMKLEEHVQKLVPRILRASGLFLIEKCVFLRGVAFLSLDSFVISYFQIFRVLTHLLELIVQLFTFTVT